MDATRTYLADSLRERRGTPALRAGDWKIALDFYAYGMTGLLLENCRQRDLDRQELADQLFRLLSGEMVRPPEPDRCARVSKSLTRGHFCQDRQPPLPVARTERTWYNHSMRAETAQ